MAWLNWPSAAYRLVAVPALTWPGRDPMCPLRERAMVSSAEPVVRDAEHDDVVAVCRFGEAHVRPHYAPLIGAAAADDEVRRWCNETHIGAAVAEGLVVVAEADGQLVGVGLRGR